MKMRLDNLVTQKLNISRSKAQDLIKNGLVFVDGVAVTKPAATIIDGQKIDIKEGVQYVSRGAYKLLKALDVFDISLQGKIVLDVGASTGGFTEVCLHNSATKVYALDIGKSQLAPALQRDRRVVNLSGTDVRTLSLDVAPNVNFIVGDLSFVSLTKILPSLFSLYPGCPAVFLFKPQFECGMQYAKKYKGIIKDKKLHINLLQQFFAFLDRSGLKLSGIDFSPITGGDGNIEYLLYINGSTVNTKSAAQMVESAFENFKNKKEC